MKAPVYVCGISKEVWFRKTRDERQVSVLNCLDREAHEGKKLKETFDYVPTPEEADELNIEALDGQNITLAVLQIKAATGGRLKFIGSIDRSTLPKGATKETGGKPTQTPPK